MPLFGYLALAAFVAFVVRSLPAEGAGRFTAWLEAQQDKKRVLLVFSPSEQDDRLRKQRSEVNWEPDGFRERDLVVVEIAGDGPVRLNGIPDASLRAMPIFAAQHIPQDQFRVQLIGKDGSIKEEWDSPIKADDLFDTIDAMPMRQAEAVQG